MPSPSRIKRPSLLLIIAVVGFCIGVAAVKLSGPLVDYAIARYLRQWGIDEASLEASYPRTGELLLKNVRLCSGPVTLKADALAVENPFFFIWGGQPPSLAAQGAVTLRLPLTETVIGAAPAKEIFQGLYALAGTFPFDDARIQPFALEIAEGGHTAHWQGHLRIESTEYFLTLQTRLENARGETLTAGVELSRLYPRGYLWWRYAPPGDAALKGNWGGMAWDDAQITSFLREDASGRVLLRGGNDAQALQILRHTILTLAPSTTP